MVTDLATNGLGVIGDWKKLGIRLDVLGMVLGVNLGRRVASVRGFGGSLLLRIRRGNFLRGLVFGFSGINFLRGSFGLRDGLRSGCGGYRNRSLNGGGLGGFIGHYT